MSEIFNALNQYSKDHVDKKSLWFVDENYDASISPSVIACTHAITNRIDIADYLAQSCTVNLSDYDCQSYERNSFDTIYLRVPKSKALLGHWVKQAIVLLKEEGELVCIGYNDEGIKNSFKKIEKAIGYQISQKLLGKGLRIAGFKKHNANLELVDDRDYEAMKLVPNDFQVRLYSKAGIYGADKIDAGSLFLYETITLHQEKLAEQVLDLGCGNGLLSILLSQQYDPCTFVATDNNITATHVCLKNFQENSIQGDVVLADCGQSLASSQFDCIVCNPPFHQGFDTSEALTLKFLTETKRLLAKNGEAWFVMNRFLKVEQLIKRLSLKFEQVSENSQFKVLRLQK